MTRRNSKSAAKVDVDIDIGAVAEQVATFLKSDLAMIRKEKRYDGELAEGEVSFHIWAQGLDQIRCLASEDAEYLLIECLNMSHSQFNDVYYGRNEGRDFTVICMPKHFVAFLVARNELGLTNGWKDLNVQFGSLKKRRAGVVIDLTMVK